MFLYPAKSYSLRHGGGATIEHTMYIYPEVDGFMENTDVAYAETWFNGTKTGQPYQYLNTFQPGAPDGGVND